MRSVNLKNNQIQRGYYRNLGGGDRELKQGRIIDTVLIYIIKNQKSIDNLSDINPDKSYFNKLVKEKSLKFPFVFFVFVSDKHIVYSLWFNEINKNLLIDNRFDNDMKIMKKYYDLFSKNKKLPKDLNINLDRLSLAYFMILALPYFEDSDNGKVIRTAKNLSININKVKIIIQSTFS